MLDITTLAAWGEFIGGIAVIISLVYLASQIRQHSKLQRASTTTATAQIQASYQALIVQDPDVARIFWQGLADLSSLSEADRQRFNPLLTLVFQGLSHRHQFAREGVAGQGTLEEVNTSLNFLSGYPGGRQWWRDWGHSFNQQFRDYVDRLIRNGESAE
jgi:hypothetical protein